MPMGLILEFFVKLGQSFFQEKAREIANLFGLNGFKASSGWLTRFKLRHSISLKRIQGKAGDIDDQALTNWQQNVLKPDLLRYNTDDIFNVDESGLFFELLPNKTMAFKGTPYFSFSKCSQNF